MGVEISPLPNKEGFVLSQPHVIGHISEALNLDPKTTKGACDNTPITYPILSKDTNGLHRKASWKYRSLIGMLEYLQDTARPDIAMSTHQCARFNINPRLSHERAAKRVRHYLLDTKDKGIIFRPDTSRGLECFVDADFVGGWKDGDRDSPKSVLSSTGFVIMFAGCPNT